MWLGDDFDSKTLAEINVTPFVDVLLVLLVIFMVTVPLAQTGILVNLPKSSNPLKSQVEEKIILSINSEKEMFINKTKFQYRDLHDKLKAIYADRDDKSIYIKADKAVVYDAVIRAMDAAKEAGVIKIGMITAVKPPNEKQKGISRKNQSTK